MSKKHSVPFHGYRLHESFLLPITPAMSTPAMSTPVMSIPATWCRDVHSRDFSAPYRVIHNIEDQVVLQWDLARLEQWAWGMAFNASKCRIMHMSRPSS